MDIPNVSVTNTKAEILEAFNKLKSLIQEPQTNKDRPFRAQVVEEVERIESILTQKRAEIEELNVQIEQLKKQLALGKNIALTQQTLQNLLDKIEEEEKQWERQKKQLEETLKDEADFSKKRVSKEIEEKKWAYEIEAKQKRRELEEEEKQFQKKYTDYETLQKQIVSFPEELKKEVRETV